MYEFNSVSDNNIVIFFVSHFGFFFFSCVFRCFWVVHIAFNSMFVSPIWHRKKAFFGFNDLFFYFLLRIWMMNGVKAARRTNKKCICQKRKRKRINGRHIRVKVFHIKAKDRRYKKNNAFSFWSMLLQPSTLCFILLNH